MNYMNLTKTVLHLVNVVEKKDITGKEKRNIVLNDMKIILADVYYFYENFIEELIEMFVSISKNELSININNDIKNKRCCF